MSHEPRTGIIDMIAAINVRTSAFGMPSKNSPSPKAKPWIIPMRTCPMTIASVILRNSCRNLVSVALENGERDLI